MFFCMAARRAGGRYVPPVRVLVAHHSSSSLVVPAGRSGLSSGMPSRSRLWFKKGLGVKVSAETIQLNDARAGHSKIYRSRSCSNARCRSRARTGSRSRNCGTDGGAASRSACFGLGLRFLERRGLGLRLGLRLRCRRRGGLGDLRDLSHAEGRRETAARVSESAEEGAGKGAGRRARRTVCVSRPCRCCPGTATALIGAAAATGSAPSAGPRCRFPVRACARASA